MKLTKRRPRRKASRHSSELPNGNRTLDHYGILSAGDVVRLKGSRTKLYRFDSVTVSPDGTESIWVYGPLPDGKRPKVTRFRAITPDRLIEEPVV